MSEYSGLRSQVGKLMSLMVLLWVPWSQQDEGRGAEGDDEECDGKGMGEMGSPNPEWKCLGRAIIFGAWLVFVMVMPFFRARRCFDVQVLGQRGPPLF